MNGRIRIFDPAGDDLSLTGFREFPSTWAIDWSLFFDFGNGAPSEGVHRIQHAYKIDTSIVNPLGALPPSVSTSTAINSLASLNLIRGNSMGLPSGQSVARAMGEAVIPDEKLKVGKATSDDPAVFATSSIFQSSVNSSRTMRRCGFTSSLKRSRYLSTTIVRSVLGQ